MNIRTVTVVVVENNEQGEVLASSFSGDELTSPEQQAILFLKSIDEDAFDGKE